MKAIGLVAAMVGAAGLYTVVGEIQGGTLENFNYFWLWLGLTVGGAVVNMSDVGIGGRM